MFISIWMAFAIALMASLLLTWPVRQFALYVGLVDRPGARKVHLRPMPLLGGVAIYGGFVLAIAATVGSPLRTEVLGILGGATLLAVTGILDDSGLLHHQVKLFAGMPLAAGILILTGTKLQLFAELLRSRTGSILDLVLTVLWVVGITAAFSILDHMDGLCAGVAAIAAAFFAISATLNGQRMVCILASAALGASLGFLRWNFAPAKIFMGDGGAMLLGFLMAALGLKLRPQVAHPATDWIVSIFILAVPIFDTTLITVSRSRRGLLPFTSPGKDHTAHRLANLGFGQKRAVLILYGVGFISGTLGVLIPFLNSAERIVLCAFFATVGAVAVMRLERSPYENQAKLPSLGCSPAPDS